MSNQESHLFHRRGQNSKTLICVRAFSLGPVSFPKEDSLNLLADVIGQGSSIREAKWTISLFSTWVFTQSPISSDAPLSCFQHTLPEENMGLPSSHLYSSPQWKRI